MKKNLPIYLLFFSLTATLLGYLPGISGTLYFDDIPNLDRLRSMTGWLLVVDFLATGIAGPAGRPISLLTFVAQQSYWPDGLPVLLATNIAIHLFAGLAVYLLAYAIALTQSRDEPTSVGYIALGTATLWLICPFLVSAQLMLIQRMTTLSGLFVFAGLASYCWGRLFQQTRPRLARHLIWAGLLGGTLLATLSKENGILLPMLALCIEWTLFKRAALRPPVRTVRYAIYLATAFVLCYLALRVPSLWTDGWRAYSPWQRLISQPPVILDYIINLLAPRTVEISPYTHWERAVSSITDARFIIAFTLLTLVSIGGVLLRRRLPVLSFAILFFLAGQIIESSIIYLELFFAHRNYVPAFSLFFALCFGVSRLPQEARRLAAIGLAGYSVICYVVLVSTTTLWGNPVLAAEMWAKQYPQSIRAQHALANSYTQLGDWATATHLLDDMEPLSGSAGLYRLQPLLFCVSEVDAEMRVQYAESRFQVGPALRGVGETLEMLTRQALAGACPSVSSSRAIRLADAILLSPAYRYEKGARAKAWYAKALVSGENDDLAGMLLYLQEAFQESRYLDVALFRASVLVSMKRFDEAQAYLDELDGAAPSNLIKRAIWQQRVKHWRQLVDAEAAISA